ncbi:voltage-gated potassium channel [Pseudovirgaria hyperparasitica]|uniref:Voltage-gated potassium channel n=1 Tax=Pseudovirgaria hyperparasitica TaxID=470096 RepID=A0A6A6W4W2_9PEZI|nr:voltage-gated potassium channel [Pseudovirgaria hyperparasitica]KAF2757595.1 voltage-gated potassium channel [Pseudovirgaria hyperparasitica]
MNDPGMDGPVGRAADDVEDNTPEKELDTSAGGEQDFLGPSRWWFASTACPLIAGTFGPMASAFSICALVEKWRVYIPEGQTEASGQAVEDPHWLIAINSVSLACALIANMALLLNMARRVSFAIAQPVTIVGWLVASALLIALVSVASSPVFRIEPASEHALTQAYYYAIMAAGLYFAVAILMIITVVGAYREHYPKMFRLTMAQRTLMLQTITFMVYLLVGALVFAKVEGWAYLDAVYWASFTLLTVGIGDYAPTTHLGRSLLFPFAIGGIVTVGLVVGSIRSLALDRGKHKLKARMTEKKREAVLSTVNLEKRTIRVGIFNSIEFAQKGLTEAQRREQEFLIMRRVQHDAQRMRQWTSLIVSTLAALTLALVGAVVFWQSEKPQGWSYFQAFYFSYVSLLTIGYGDISPTSNSGKAFFVFWSLLAVPTLTILISNMGDTVVKVFRDLVIWIGAFTVLPGERGTKEALNDTMSRVKQYMHPKKSYHGIFGQSGHERDTAHRIEEVSKRRLAACFEKEELMAADDAGSEGEDTERDVHFYNYVLVSEIRNVMKDVNASPPKRYSYGEWAHFLKLLGQDEHNPEHHRTPPIVEDKNVRPGQNEQSRLDFGKAGYRNVGSEALAWSWLGIRSPLLGNQSEAEWVLERLTATLEFHLKSLQAGRQLTGTKHPPIRRSDLTKH